MAANITRFEVRENESQTADDFMQGRNSWTSVQAESDPRSFPPIMVG
ncbi:hypothetical protein IMSAGC005_03043 [Lachnospiraceae bacterium]|nr:hypothetical protein IMSAGC005_03043 [Lachnospiraceae bacterium]